MVTVYMSGTGLGRARARIGSRATANLNECNMAVDCRQAKVATSEEISRSEGEVLS